MTSPRSLTLALLAVVCASAAGACGFDTAAARSAPVTRPASKTTCPEVTFDSGLQPLDRRLVPYSQTLLAVETVWGDADGARVHVVSGGYLDDVLEAYDDLHEVDTITLRGEDALILESSLQGRPVRVAVWREPVTPPCDARAVIATGLSEQAFLEQLSHLR